MNPNSNNPHKLNNTTEQHTHPKTKDRDVSWPFVDMDVLFFVFFFHSDRELLISYAITNYTVKPTFLFELFSILNTELLLINNHIKENHERVFRCFITQLVSFCICDQF